MSSLKIETLGLDELEQDLRRKWLASRRETALAVKDGAERVRAYGFTLVKAPTLRGSASVNVQDSSRPRYLRFGNGLVQARMDAEKGEAQIRFAAHTTGARSKAVSGVLRQLGQEKERRALWIKRRTWGQNSAGRYQPQRKNRSHRRHESRAGLEKVSLRKPWLNSWAKPKDLHKRDTVRLKGEALRRVIAGPSLYRNREGILKRIEEATHKALDS